MRTLATLLIAVGSLLASTVEGSIGIVPDQFATIQAAINAPPAPIPKKNPRRVNLIGLS